MRLTSFGIVLVLMTSFMAGRASAQIPERALFQPGSYAFGYTAAQNHPAAGGQMVTQTVLVEAPAKDAEESSDDTAGKADLTEVSVQAQVKQVVVPYLAYHRCPITHRIHVIPYEPGYALSPQEFPKHQSKVNLYLSSLPCRTQDRPQVKYAGYYDPDPVIIQDKPSRVQLILGYPNGAWTSCCDNRWGGRLAQCPGVNPVAAGPCAEPAIKDQCCEYGYGYGHHHYGHGHGHHRYCPKCHRVIDTSKVAAEEAVE